MKILQLTVHFKPNIGGVETHLNDLCNSLVKKHFNVFVLCYRPLNISASWKVYEKDGNLEVFRIPWFPHLFYKLISHPFWEFLYLAPGLFLVTPFIIIWKNPDVLHSHGLVAGFVAVFWGKVFNKKVIVTTHSIYHFPTRGIYRIFAKFIFNSATICLTLSKQAKNELEALNIDTEIDNFTYWIDLNNFKKVLNAKKTLNWERKFTVLFVGRLVKEKGLIELLDSAKTWDKEIRLVIIGSGPLEEEIKRTVKKYKNVNYLGKIDQEKLPIYYSGSDILVIPSTSEEGFGRVILESLACGTPIVGSNRGAIPEAVDKTVSILIDITPQSLKKEVEYLSQHPELVAKLAKNCRGFAERRYSEKNVETIIKSYQK